MNPPNPKYPFQDTIPSIRNTIITSNAIIIGKPFLTSSFSKFVFSGLLVNIVNNINEPSPSTNITILAIILDDTVVLII